MKRNLTHAVAVLGPLYSQHSDFRALEAEAIVPSRPASRALEGLGEQPLGQR